MPAKKIARMACSYNSSKASPERCSVLLQIPHQQPIFQLHIRKHRQVQHMAVAGGYRHGLALAVFQLCEGKAQIALGRHQLQAIADGKAVLYPHLDQFAAPLPARASVQLHAIAPVQCLYPTVAIHLSQFGLQVPQQRRVELRMAGDVFHQGQKRQSLTRRGAIPLGAHHRRAGGP